VAAWSRAILALAADGGSPALSWLDGGDSGRGFFGRDPDLEVVGDDLRLLDRVEERWRAAPDLVWMGWLTYDLGADFVLGRRAPAHGLARLTLRRYADAVELEGDELRAHGDARACEDLRRRLERAPTTSSAWPLGPLEPRLADADYRARVRLAQAHIEAGDTYQVNLSHGFAAPWCEAFVDESLSRRAASVYASLRTRAPATMGALVCAPVGWILSNSPETLLDVRRMPDGTDMARSWPIKGTRPRHADALDDVRAGDELTASAKDGAEHIMIVDLVRNDLGRLAVPGTVRAPRRPELMTLPTVHHLVSQIECELRPGWTLRGLIEAMFPGGSVTGAPKRRTMEIIDALEGEPRGIYCGALVVLEPGGLRLSIAIRTGLLDDHGLHLRSGGGIVADSDPELERLETIDKTRAFAPS
jgi:anthranilate/para-aminobenzoate synthase component I